MAIPTKPIAIPRNIPMHEMTQIIGGKDTGMTHAQIKTHIDQGRRMSGTYRGKGISTNTISRLLGKTHGKAYKARISEAWLIYDKKTRQRSMFQATRDKIVESGDKESLKRFDKMTAEVLERQRGRQYELEAQYDAETDEFVIYSA